MITIVRKTKQVRTDNIVRRRRKKMRKIIVYKCIMIETLFGV
jgi:hypothetical protein